MMLLIIFIALPLQAELLLYDTKQKRYAIDNKRVNESSGLACSKQNKNILWTHNDSGHAPIIYAMSSKGKDRGTFYLNDIDANDWEDMDAFEYQGEHYLLIADTGDNLRFRWDYQIVIIKEPLLEKGNDSSRSAISPAWSYVFKYADNKSYDVEAVAVDVLREKIILLTKRTSHAYLFELPLKPLDNGKMPEAVKVAELKDIVKPTGLDISSDGTLMSINTYARIHRFRRAKLTDKWHYEYSLKYKKLFQPEALCLRENAREDAREDDNVYFVSSERKPYLIKIKVSSKHIKNNGKTIGE